MPQGQCYGFLCFVEEKTEAQINSTCLYAQILVAMISQSTPRLMMYDEQQLSMRVLRKLSECKCVILDHNQGQCCLVASRMSVVSKLKETNFVICDPSLPAEKFLMRL